MGQRRTVVRNGRERPFKGAQIRTTAADAHRSGRICKVHVERELVRALRRVADRLKEGRIARRKRWRSTVRVPAHPAKDPIVVVIRAVLCVCVVNREKRLPTSPFFQPTQSFYLGAAHSCLTEQRFAHFPILSTKPCIKTTMCSTSVKAAPATETPHTKRSVDTVRILSKT
jgi:hypothetical protein